VRLGICDRPIISLPDNVINQVALRTSLKLKITGLEKKDQCKTFNSTGHPEKKVDLCPVNKCKYKTK